METLIVASGGGAMTQELKQNAATGARASSWKPYPAYKDSGVEWLGKVPEHWEVRKLKWVSNLIYGSSLSNDQRIEGKIPVYGSNGIIGYHNQAISKKPCIIIGRKGSFGKINYSNIECFPIDTTYYIDETATKNDLLWLLYVLSTQNLDSLSKDSAVPGLSREDAYDKLIFVPPIPEQRAISFYLDDRTRKIDSLIEKKQKMIELLKEERAAVINQAVTKGLNPDVPMKDSGIEWLGKVPEKWEVKRLKYISTKIGSGVTPKGGSATYLKEGIPLLRSQNIQFDRLDFDDVAYISEETHNQMSGSKVYPNDVLLNITGASIGRCHFVPFDLKEANVNQHVCIIRPNNKIITKYLFDYLSSEKGQIQVFSSEKGISREGLTFEQIKNFSIIFPQIEEQKSIVQFIESESAKIDSAVSTIEKEILLLQEYRTALISEVVTGKIDVRGG